MLTGNGAPDEDRTRRNSIDSRVPSPAGSRSKLQFAATMVRPPRLELGCTRRAPLKRGCLPFHHGREIVFSKSRFSAGRSFELEDQVGLEPTVTCVDGLRIRSLGRWGHWSVIGGSGWFRTTCARVKRPLHLQSGLTLRIHRLDGCGGKPRRFRMACRDGIASFPVKHGRLSVTRRRTPERRSCRPPLRLVLQSGIEPASTAYRAVALPLCYKSVNYGALSRNLNRGQPPCRGGTLPLS